MTDNTVENVFELADSSDRSVFEMRLPQTNTVHRTKARRTKRERRVMT